MPATVRQSELSEVAQLLFQLARIDGTAPAGLDLDAEEIALVVKHRREKIVKALANKGIDVKPDQVPEPVRLVEEAA